ncbi:MAG: fibronectin type III domain-containing protein [Clostridia bacterium]|nr:fibronectin type III domain-containing protein [Clostridia bacterium]
MEPTISDVTENGFTIFANVEDEEATNENAKSGIEKCEYYINGVKYESSETKYTIDILEPNTEYSIYIIAYDKAGNNSEQSTQITQRTKDEYVDFETYINSHMQVDKKIYISSEYGNDITGNGTQDNPYLTLDKIKEAGIIENGYSYAIVLMNGEYTLTTKIFDLNCNKNINIIGNRRRTILNVGSMFNNSGKGSANYSINFYRLIWNFVQRSTQGLNCKTTTTYHNVAFVNNVNDDNWGFFTSFYNNILEFENCTSIGKYGEGLRANEGGAKVTNCYGKFSVFGANNLKIDENTNYITNEPKVDNSTYQITDSENLWKNKGIGTNPDGSQANFGVYGGEYSWEE